MCLCVHTLAPIAAFMCFTYVKCTCDNAVIYDSGTINVRQGQPQWEGILDTDLTHDTLAFIHSDDCLLRPPQLSHMYISAKKRYGTALKRLTKHDKGD